MSFCYTLSFVFLSFFIFCWRRTQTIRLHGTKQRWNGVESSGEFGRNKWNFDFFFCTHTHTKWTKNAFVLLLVVRLHSISKMYLFLYCFYPVQRFYALWHVIRSVTAATNCFRNISSFFLNSPQQRLTCEIDLSFVVTAF